MLQLFVVGPNRTAPCACGPAVQFTLLQEAHSILCLRSCCAVTLVQHSCVTTAPPPAKLLYPSHLPQTSLSSRCQTCIRPVNESLAHLSSGHLVTAVRSLRAGCQLLSAWPVPHHVAQCRQDTLPLCTLLLLALCCAGRWRLSWDPSPSKAAAECSPQLIERCWCRQVDAGSRVAVRSC